MTGEPDTTEQLTLFGPETEAMEDRIIHLKLLMDRYKALVTQHDRLVNVMMGKMNSATMEVTAFRRGSTRISHNEFPMDMDDVEYVLNRKHQRILDAMKEAFDKLQEHKDTI